MTTCTITFRTLDSELTVRVAPEEGRTVKEAPKEVTMSMISQPSQKAPPKDIHSQDLPSRPGLLPHPVCHAGGYYF